MSHESLRCATEHTFSAVPSHHRFCNTRLDRNSSWMKGQRWSSLPSLSERFVFMASSSPIRSSNENHRSTYYFQPGYIWKLFSSSSYTYFLRSFDQHTHTHRPISAHTSCFTIHRDLILCCLSARGRLVDIEALCVFMNEIIVGRLAQSFYIQWTLALIALFSCRIFIFDLFVKTGRIEKFAPYVRCELYFNV